MWTVLRCDERSSTSTAEKPHSWQLLDIFHIFTPSFWLQVENQKFSCSLFVLVKTASQKHKCNRLWKSQNLPEIRLDMYLVTWSKPMYTVGRICLTRGSSRSNIGLLLRMLWVVVCFHSRRLTICKHSCVRHISWAFRSAISGKQTMFTNRKASALEADNNSQHTQ